MTKQVTDAELLTALQNLATELAKVPTAQEMTDHGPHAHTLYYSRFNSWTRALKFAGLTDESGAAITDSELCDELRRLADKFGRPPTIAEMEAEGAYSVSTYYRRFGSWLDARDAAGLTPTEIHPSRRLTDGELLDEIKRLADELGRTPTTTDMDTHGNYGLRTYYTRFDGWAAALEAAGLSN